jgi:hypothetical protein
VRRGNSNLAGDPADVPRCGRDERIADAAVHVVGLSAASLACVALGATLTRATGLGPAVALGLYAAGLMATLGCSALYNLADEGARKALMRRLDHAAIFAMIAGTYTPVVGLGIGGAWGRGLLGVVWIGALGGAALRAPSRPRGAPAPRSSARARAAAPRARLSVRLGTQAERARRRRRVTAAAAWRKASAEAMVPSKSLARRRFRLSQAKVRSTVAAAANLTRSPVEI